MTNKVASKKSPTLYEALDYYVNDIMDSHVNVESELKFFERDARQLKKLLTQLKTSKGVSELVDALTGKERDKFVKRYNIPIVKIGKNYISLPQ